MGAILGNIELPFGGPGVVNGGQMLDVNTDALEMVFQAREAVPITRGGFRQGTLTGASPTWRLSLQGVTATGTPDGTVKGGASPASVTFTTPAGGNGTWQWKNFTNAYTPARGEWLALVLQYSSGTINASNGVSVVNHSGLGNQANATPYTLTNEAGTRTRQVFLPSMGYGSATRAFGYPTLTTPGSIAFNSASTPDERGSLINIPTTWWETYKIAGAVFYGLVTGGTTLDLVLYDTDGSTVLQNVTFDTDYVQAAAVLRRFEVLFDEATLATLSAGSGYRLVLKPSATSQSLVYFTTATGDDMDAWYGGQDVCKGTTRTDAGAWTDDATLRHSINPLITEINAPSGSSNLLKVGAMTGGIQRT